MLLTVPDAESLRHQGAQVRIVVDGRDVTSYSVAADDVQGWALLMVCDGTGTPVGRRHQGRVVATLMPVLGQVRFAYDLTIPACDCCKRQSC